MTKQRVTGGNYFITDLNKSSSVFNFIFSLHDELEKYDLKLDHEGKVQLLHRIFRTGLLASVIYDYGNRTPRDNVLQKEFLAALTEAYFFLLRTLYDYFTKTLNKNGISIPNNFSEFKKMYNKNKYKGLIGNKTTLVTVFNWFNEFTSIRNTIKSGNSNIEIYIKSGEYFIKGKWDDRLNGCYKNFDDRLSQVVFNYSLIVSISWKFLLSELTPNTSLGNTHVAETPSATPTLDKNAP